MNKILENKDQVKYLQKRLIIKFISVKNNIYRFKYHNILIIFSFL